MPSKLQADSNKVAAANKIATQKRLAPTPQYENEENGSNEKMEFTGFTLRYYTRPIRY